MHDIVVLQGYGDYDAAAAFIETCAHVDTAVEIIFESLNDISVDIQPECPDEI